MDCHGSEEVSLEYPVPAAARRWRDKVVSYQYVMYMRYVIERGRYIRVSSIWVELHKYLQHQTYEIRIRIGPERRSFERS